MNRIYLNCFLAIGTTISCIAGLTRCSSSDECKRLPIRQLPVTTEKVEVPLIGKQGYYHSISDIVWSQDTLYYFGLDGGGSVIDVYNLTSKTFTKQIALAKEGPSPIRHYDGQIAMAVLSLDSIVLINPYKDFYVVNGEGQVLSHKHFDFSSAVSDFPFESLHFLSLGLSEYASSSLTLDLNNNVYSALMWSDNFYETANFRGEYELPPFIGIPIDQPDSFFFVGKYPLIETGNKVPRSILNSIAFDNGGKPVIQFESFHQLYSSSNGFECAHYAEEELIFRKYEDSKVLSEEEELEALIVDPAYVALVSDPARGLFYRFLKHKQEYSQNEEVEKRRLQADFSIQVFSDKFEYLGERRFPGGKYDFLKPHVLPDGSILLSKETSANSNNREEFLEFDIIKFKL